jgi:hypothetical protein
MSMKPMTLLKCTDRLIKSETNQKDYLVLNSISSDIIFVKKATFCERVLLFLLNFILY